MKGVEKTFASAQTKGRPWDVIVITPVRKVAICPKTVKARKKMAAVEHL